MAVTRMRFQGSGATTYYIDLAYALSLQRRKLHRQKKIYTVYGGFFVDTPSGATDVSRVNLNTAPNTWVARTAVNRGFRMWKKMISETLEDAEGVRPGKYNDYKVFLNSPNVTPWAPVDAAGNNLYTNIGEWDYSTMTSALGAEDANGVRLPADSYDLQIVGTHGGTPADASNPAGFTRVALIKSWLESRPALDAHDPDHAPTGTASLDPLANLFADAEVHDERVVVIETEGDIAPYDEVSMFGMVSTGTSDNNLQRQSVAVTSQQNPIGAVHGFQALCGLIQVECTSADSTWELVLDVESVGEEF